MMGTKNRPLSHSLVSAPGALVFGFALSGLSLTRLWLATNALSALLAAATIASYVLICPGLLNGPHPQNVAWGAPRGACRAGRLGDRDRTAGLGARCCCSWWFLSWTPPHALGL